MLHRIKMTLLQTGFLHAFSDLAERGGKLDKKKEIRRTSRMSCPTINTVNESDPFPLFLDRNNEQP